MSHPYMTTGKTIALTGWTFVGKIMSLLFNMLFSLLIKVNKSSADWTSGKVGESVRTVLLSLDLEKCQITSDMQMTPPLW